MIFDLLIDMTAGNEDVLPPVIVVVDETVAPAKKWNRIFGDAGLIACVTEIQIAVVPIQHLVVIGKIGVQYVEAPVISIVAYSDAHGRCLAAIMVDRITGLEAEILECTVTLVAVEIVWSRVICHQQLRLPV